MKDESPAQPAPTKAEKRADPAPVKTAKPKRPGRLTLDELRAAEKAPAWLHDAAAVIHGWNEYTTEPIRLERDDYLQALDAAKRPGAGGHYEPHVAAMTDAAKAERKAK